MRPFYIVLAEANEALRCLFSYLLLREGYEVKVVENSKAALNALTQRKPDAVITDIDVPEEDGLELIKWIRSQKDMQEVPVLAITEYKDDMLAQAQRAGATKAITKPAHHRLCTEVQNILLGELATC